MRTVGAVVGLIVAVIVIQALTALAVYHLLPSWETRGQFGDLFGSVNALFSGMAFAGLIYTVLLQRNELQLQRDELRMTRAELARSAQAQERSERALSSQASAMQTSAEIAAINNLLSYVHSEIQRLGSDQTSQIVYRDELSKLYTQRSNLISNLNTLYSASVAARVGS